MKLTLATLIILSLTSSSISMTKHMLEQKRRHDIMAAIMVVESQNGKFLHNVEEDAVGYLQIRKIMVREVNRLTGKTYSYNDRWNKNKSLQMFTDYQDQVNPKWDAELAARLWNGGITGDKKPSTTIYWHKVRKVLEKITKG